jgi:transposase
VLDNLGQPQRAGRSTGCPIRRARRVFLPPCGPDLNPTGSRKAQIQNAGSRRTHLRNNMATLWRRPRCLLAQRMRKLSQKLRI